MARNQAPIRVRSHDCHVHRIAILARAFGCTARFAPAKLANRSTDRISIARRSAICSISISAADSGERHNWRIGGCAGRLPASASRATAVYVVLGHDNAGLRRDYDAGRARRLGNAAKFHAATQRTIGHSNQTCPRARPRADAIP